MKFWDQIKYGWPLAAAIILYREFYILDGWLHWATYQSRNNQKIIQKIRLAERYNSK